jgi:hypothetical protein
VKKEATKYLFWEEIQKQNQILQKKFKKLDVEESGKITLANLVAVLKLGKMTSLKEMNILLNYYAENGEYDYRGFGEHLYEIRYNFLKSQLLDHNIGGLESHIINILSAKDKKQSGFITIEHLQDALLHSKKINLTPLQVNIYKI